jgi:hypothetical protein
LFILDPDLVLPIPDPGVKKALDSGSGSATLVAVVVPESNIKVVHYQNMKRDREKKNF